MDTRMTEIKIPLQQKEPSIPIFRIHLFRVLWDTDHSAAVIRHQCVEANVRIHMIRSSLYSCHFTIKAVVSW
jgi:GTP cyclohydrolase II